MEPDDARPTDRPAMTPSPIVQQAPGPAERGPGGRFQRQQSRFRDWVTADGSSGVPARAGRYHLYVSLACPWAHRTIILRRLKGLEAAIGMSIVDPIRDERGWAFGPAGGPTADHLHGWSLLAQAYQASDPSFVGRVTVPVLWDRETGRIVNNESADIVVMLNSAFDGVAAHPERDFHPPDGREEREALQEIIYETVNNGVYRAGFAATQDAYDEAVLPVFETLDMLDARLADRRFLFGPRPTLADWRLFPTLVRFDSVYVGHFKCNLRRIVDYPHLWPYVRDLYQTPGVAETVDFDHIKRHYHVTHRQINPTGIVPAGPLVDFAAPHDRARLA
jgi:putative glutathione S-transferase